MDLDLGSQWESFIAENVRFGRYGSATDVVRDGLRLLKARQQPRSGGMRNLRAKIAKGVEQLDAGNFVELDEDELKECFKQIKNQGRRRLARTPPAP